MFIDKFEKIYEYVESCLGDDNHICPHEIIDELKFIKERLGEIKMIKKVFGIYDGKACAFLQPLLFMNTPGEAIRMFESAVNDDKSMMNKYPQDFILFEIAEYDDNTGRFKSYDINKNLGCAIDYFKDKDVKSYNEPIAKVENISKKE